MIAMSKGRSMIPLESAFLGAANSPLLVCYMEISRIRHGNHLGWSPSVPQVLCAEDTAGEWLNEMLLSSGWVKGHFTDN